MTGYTFKVKCYYCASVGCALCPYREGYMCFYDELLVSKGDVE